MQVMVLAAGRSTRLSALGGALPKPVVPVCGYPVVLFPLALCRAAGLTDVVVNLHHLPEAVRTVLGDGAAHGVRVRYSYEAALLGTGGALAHARKLFSSEPVLILNGKIVADVDLQCVLAAHARARAEGAVATMVVRRGGGKTRVAPVEVDASGNVVGLRGERARIPQGATEHHQFLGIHIVESALIDRLPAHGPSDVVAQAYLPALRAGHRVATFEAPGYFEEHSTPEQYFSGNLALLRRPERVPVVPGPLCGIAPNAVVHPTAVIEDPVQICAGAVVEAGAHLGPDVVVGAGARIAAGVSVQRAVIWDGSVVDVDVSDSIVTGRAVVTIPALAEPRGANGADEA